MGQHSFYLQPTHKTAIPTFYRYCRYRLWVFFCRCGYSEHPHLYVTELTRDLQTPSLVGEHESTKGRALGKEAGSQENIGKLPPCHKKEKETATMIHAERAMKKKEAGKDKGEAKSQDKIGKLRKRVDVL